MELNGLASVNGRTADSDSTPTFLTNTRARGRTPLNGIDKLTRWIRLSNGASMIA
jgi:hypothetical protein